MNNVYQTKISIQNIEKINTLEKFISDIRITINNLPSHLIQINEKNILNNLNNCIELLDEEVDYYKKYVRVDYHKIENNCHIEDDSNYACLLEGGQYYPISVRLDDEENYIWTMSDGSELYNLNVGYQIGIGVDEKEAFNDLLYCFLFQDIVEEIENGK